jgi:hypothetical protein
VLPAHAISASITGGICLLIIVLSLRRGSRSVVAPVQLHCCVRSIAPAQFAALQNFS